MKEKPGYRPITVVGPIGPRRVIVRDGSTGLQLHYLSLGIGAGRFYKLDETNGKLYINRAHPLFVECDEKSETVLLKYIVNISVQALTLASFSKSYPDQRELLEKFFEETFRGVVYHILNKGL